MPFELVGKNVQAGRTREGERFLDALEQALPETGRGEFVLNTWVAILGRDCPFGALQLCFYELAKLAPLEAKAAEAAEVAARDSAMRKAADKAAAAAEVAAADEAAAEEVAGTDAAAKDDAREAAEREVAAREAAARDRRPLRVQSGSQRRRRP